MFSSCVYTEGKKLDVFYMLHLCMFIIIDTVHTICTPVTGTTDGFLLISDFRVKRVILTLTYSPNMLP